MRSAPTSILIVLLFAFVGCGQSRHQQVQTAAAESSTLAPAEFPATAGISESLDLQQYIVTRSVGADSVQIIESTCIVALPPTIGEAAQAQEEGTEADFEAAADDYTFYFSDVIERAEMAHIPIVDASKRFLRFMISDAVSVLIDSRAAGIGFWNPVLFRKGSPPVFYQLVGDADTNRIQYFFGR